MPDLPQLSSCGPIEALPLVGRRSHSVFLPQLSSCGPIEAVITLVIAVVGGTFRNCQVAAPLKRPSTTSPMRSLQPSATVKLRPH